MVKSQLNQSNHKQKNQLESKLSNIENKIKTLTSRDKSTIQELEKEIKEIKEKIKSDKPKDNPPPTDENQLQFTVYYYVKLGQNHMWIDHNSDKIILIDKENSIFPNNELTQKNHNYTITFSAKDAEKYHNQDHVFYFSKNNNKFTLKPHNPEPSDKNELKVSFGGEGYSPDGGLYFMFSFLEPKSTEEVKYFCVSKSHPQVKELLKAGKLQLGKKFTICYKKVDSHRGKIYYFDGFNQDLEIIEI